MLLTTRLHILWMMIVELFRHDAAWKDFIDCSLVNWLLLISITLFAIQFFFFPFAFFLNLGHSPAQIFELEVSSCFRALVLLASFIVGIYTLIIFEVNVIYVIIDWDRLLFFMVWKLIQIISFAIIGHFSTGASATCIVVEGLGCHFVLSDCLSLISNYSI